MPVVRPGSSGRAAVSHSASRAMIETLLIGAAIGLAVDVAFRWRGKRRADRARLVRRLTTYATPR